MSQDEYHILKSSVKLQLHYSVDLTIQARDFINLLSDENPPEVQFFRKSGGGWVLDRGEVDLRVV